MTPQDLQRQFSEWLTSRVEAIAKEEMDAARERLTMRIPELAAEIGIRLTQHMNHTGNEAILQVLIRPKL